MHRSHEVRAVEGVEQMAGLKLTESNKGKDRLDALEKEQEFFDGFGENGRWNADYTSVYSLLSHLEELPDATLVDKLFQTLTAQFCLQKNFQATPEGNTEWMDAARLLHHLCQTQTNVYAVFEVGEDNTEGKVVQRRLAEGIYPTCSLFNHSCQPNTTLCHNGRLLTIRYICVFW